MAELIVTLKGRELSRVPITKTDTVIGRDASADVRIDNPGVSRTHAIVRYRDFVFRVWDHGSANGLLVNGERVEWSTLADGDVIVIGRHNLHFVDAPASAGTRFRRTHARGVV